MTARTTPSSPPLIVVAGATATGKSGLAVELAQRVNGEIINADAMQFYRGMDIGTAKITAAERHQIPHHLLDILHVTDEASVASYQHQARTVIQEVRDRGATPLLVGGSGLYIRAVIDDIAFPPTDPALRKELTEALQVDGAAALRRELHEHDPEAAAAVRDDRRLVRALEVVRLTGKPFSAYMPRRVYHESSAPVIQLGLTMNRGLLHQRIAQRVHHMRSQGFLAEVTSLDSEGLRQGRTASRAIGYQQYLQVIDGVISEDQAVDDCITATRQFARRQETWFTADPRIHWITPDVPGTTVLSQALDQIPHP